MGGWKASGLGSRHGPDGIRKYTKRQSLMVTPGYAPVARRPHASPTTRAGHPDDRPDRSRARGERPLQRRAAGDAGRPLRHLRPLARAARRRAGSRRVLGRAPPRTSASRRGSRSRCCRRARPRSRSRASASCWTRSPSSGMAAGDPAGPARGDRPRVLRLGARHARRDQRAPWARRRPFTTRFRTSAPAATRTGRRSVIRGRSSAPPDVPKPLPIRRPSGSGEDVIEADVCVVGSGAGGGVIAGELAGAGKQVCVLEMGGYSQRGRLRPARAARLPAPLPERAGRSRPPTGRSRSVAGAGLGGGTVINWTNCLRTHQWVREEWARDFGLEGLDGAEYDGHLDAVLERIGRERRLQRPERAARAAAGGVRDARLRLPPHRPQRRPRDAMTRRVAGYMGFGDQSGSKLSTQKTYLVDAQATEPTSSPTAAPSGSSSRAAAPPGSRPAGSIPSRPGGERRSARESGARSGGRRRGRARSSRRRCCLRSGSAAPRSASTCGSTRRAR